MLYPHSFIV